MSNIRGSGGKRGLRPVSRREKKHSNFMDVLKKVRLLPRDFSQACFYSSLCMQEAKMQQQAAEKAKILTTTQRQPAAAGEELESRISGGGKAVSSKAKSIKAAARSGATSAASTRSSKVRLFSYCCFKRVSIVYVFSRPEAESAAQ